MKKPRVLPRAGYGNPPKHSRFQKGKSGNPKGRPKGSKNIATAVLALLRKKFTVTDNGEKKRLTGSEVVANKVFAQAAASNPRAVLLLMDIEAKRLGEGSAEPTEDSELDMTILESFRKTYQAPKAQARAAKAKHKKGKKR
jgi:hypothetical protein